MAARATSVFEVSIEIGRSICARNFSITGITRRNSSSAATGLAPGRVDSPPTSIMSAPCAAILRPPSMAFSAEKAIEGGLRMAAQGADIIDVGGESTRPGAKPVAADEELRRVIPVIEKLRAQIDLPISIDTSKTEVARAAIQAGASIVNDVTGGRGDQGMLTLVAETDSAFIIMHMQGTPRTMQIEPRYADVVSEV